MNYISEKEFRSQTEKVQNNLIEWWNSIPKNKRIYDLAIIKNSDMAEIVWYYPSGVWKDLIPLLQMHQLIDFIEEKTNEKFKLDYDVRNGYNICFYNRDDIWTYKHDLLQALWKATIKIAEEALNE
ncbi:hypothetical protein AB2Z22_000412 [Clostridium botulinum]